MNKCSAFRFFLLIFPTFAVNTNAQHLPATSAEWRTQKLDLQFFSEGATAGDINGDGKADIVSGPYWYMGPTFAQRHAFYEPKPFDPHGYSDNFFSYVHDFNGDKQQDILVIGFPGQAAYWFENPGDTSTLWPRYIALDSVDNESPTFADLTGDGQPELICNRGGFFGYATPDSELSNAPWTFHPISPQTNAGRFTHGLGVGDVNCDGRIDLLEKSGWWEQPMTLADDQPWTKHPVEFSGPGGSQMFTFDIDGDGDLDVLTALAAHGNGIAWYEHQRQGERVEFQPHLIVGTQPTDTEYGVVFSQPHAIAAGDVDGDGLMDFVSGKRPWAHGPHGDAEPNAEAVLYWFRGTRTIDAKGQMLAEFVPQRIATVGGVGVDVQLHDLNSDGRLDVVVGSKQGTFVHIQQTNPLTESELARNKLQPQRDAAKPLPNSRLPTEGLSPQEAAKQMTVPEGFAVDLVAGEPDLHQPVAFCFDLRGRIWVAEAHTYPTRAPNGQGRDKIMILEDKDHDGSFETKKTFCENLNLVSGMEVGFGGVWVGAAPYLMFIPDANGDDSPDGEPLVLLDGFGFQDTHETLNGFTWGPDGWLYGCHGIFTHSKVGKLGTPDDQRIGLNAGVWRYHPTQHEFEVFAGGSSNPWGVDFDEHGQALITACVIPHAYHVIQGGLYQRQAGTHFNSYAFDDIKTIADHAHYTGNLGDHAWWGRNSPADDKGDAVSKAGGGHAHCGAMIYQGDNWPANYRGGLFMANIHGNRINQDRPRRNGSGFVCAHGNDLLFANDPWFRGIAIKVGPDGAAYMIDWYDKNACHRTQPEIWDRTNGRLYRVRYGEVTARSINLEQASDAELIALHESHNQWQVRSARHALQSRYALGNADRSNMLTTREKLWQQVLAKKSSAERLDRLWTCHGLQAISDNEALQLLASDDENLRAWAIQLSLEDHQVSDDVLSNFVERAKNESSWRVRLYLASALQRLPVEYRWDLAVALMSHADSQYDSNLPLMIWYGVEPLVPADPIRALSLVARCQIPQVRQYICRRTAVDPQLVNELVNAIADTKDPAVQTLMVAELRGAAEKLGRISMPPRWPEVTRQLATSKDESTRQAIQFLSIGFGDASMFPALRSAVLDETLPVNLRTQSLASLVQGKDKELTHLVVKLLDDESLRQPALVALAQIESSEAAPAVVARLPSWPNELKQIAINALISRAAATHILLDAMRDGKLPRNELTAIHVSKIQELGDATLLTKLNEFWGTIRATPEETRKQIADLKLSFGKQKVSLQHRAQGREVFAKACGICHKIYGEGGEVGPDLTGANRASLDYLLENILDPNAVVGKDYQSVTVLTEDGRVISGLVREDSAATLVLHDAQKLVTIPRSEIESITPTNRSFMPEGLLKPLTKEQVTTLLAYLQSAGQVPLPGQGPMLDEQTGRVDGAIEAETLKSQPSAGNSRGQQMDSFKADRWSGNNHLWWTGGKPGEHIDITFDVPQDGDFEVFATMTKAHDYGEFSIAIDDTIALPKVDLYDKLAVVTTGPLSLGTHHLKSGPHRLRATIIGANPAATPQFMFGLDYLYLRPVK